MKPLLLIPIPSLELNGCKGLQRVDGNDQHIVGDHLHRRHAVGFMLWGCGQTGVQRFHHCNIIENLSKCSKQTLLSREEFGQLLIENIRTSESHDEAMKPDKSGLSTTIPDCDTTGARCRFVRVDWEKYGEFVLAVMSFVQGEQCS